MTKKRSTTSERVPTFATKLKGLRMTQNWSLRDVQKRMGNAVSRQTVLRAEQGDVELDTLLKLLNLYGVNAKAERDSFLASFNEHELSRARKVA